MRIKSIELNNFKRFSHLIVKDIPESAKLVVLVGPNGSGKTSFLEALNHFYKFSGYSNFGDKNYLVKSPESMNNFSWIQSSAQLVRISFHDFILQNDGGHNKIKGRFYFRSAYRNEPDFQIDSMQRQKDPTASVRLSTLIENDQAVSENYQRLVANTIAGVYTDQNDERTVRALRNELTGRIRSAIENVFEDLKFSNIGNPLQNGNFYFDKGTTKDFNYRNLSAGEKAAFDLILDLVVQAPYYPDAIYCIDEPETHMHTKLQGKVLRELYSLVPENSQMFISTHSIGMIQEAEELEKEHPGTVIFLDFGSRDFDTDQTIRPAKIRKAAIEKFYELAFGDFAKLMLPRIIVFCEGDHSGNKRKDFDKAIYSTIFEETHPDAFFISGGSCNDIERIETTHGAIFESVLQNTTIIKIVDRDDRSKNEIKDLANKNIRVLKKRNLESYLLDDSIIEKLCKTEGKSEKYNECIRAKETALANSISRGNAKDDIKSARCEIYDALKQILGLTQCGNTADAFIRDTLAPLFTNDLEIYKELESEIFCEAECKNK